MPRPNRDIKTINKKQRLRETHYRFGVFRTPSAADERKEDILPLINHFIERKKGKTVRISKEALSLLERYEWKGNVRELENCIENICTFHDSPIIDTQDLPAWIMPHQNTKQNLELTTYKEAQNKFEQDYLNNLVQLYGGNLKAASAFAEIELSTLYRKLKKHGIKYSLKNWN